MAATLLHPNLSPIRSSLPSCNCITYRPRISIVCSDSSSPNRGFGPKSRNKKLKSSPKQSSGLPNRNPTLHTIAKFASFSFHTFQRNDFVCNPYAEAPSLSSASGGKKTYTSPDDLEFEQRLQNIRKSALEQKKAEEVKEYGVIDYDAPAETNNSSIGLGTKIGVGVAVVVFGLVFALGDFLPSGSVSTTEEAQAPAVNNKISEQERAILEKRLKQFEETLAISPEDPTALEGAAVTLAEMRDYKRAATFLEKLTEKKPSDPDAYRVLGEVKYELNDYEGSVLAYRNAERASKGVDFEILRGLTNSLLAAKKPDEAVQLLLASRERLNKETSTANTYETRSDVDPIQVELLLGKAYSDWGHISDAVAVYDQLISSHPDDFRGYLAKGIILKENGNIGDAERMFVQARFFAPEKAKILVDKYSR